jgi:hypothetical protein
MATRTRSQKTGAQGHRIAASIIEEHPDWLARELGEDYGVDLEAEGTEHGVRGEILKAQIKSSRRVRRSDVAIRAVIDAKYIAYADACRYPVIFILVDVSTKESWYIWLQKWALEARARSEAADRAGQFTCWIPKSDTLRAGLDSELKGVARWQGNTQFALSLLDALRAAAGVVNSRAVAAVIQLIDENERDIAEPAVNVIAREAVRLGDRLRGTEAGNILATQMFDLVRRVGARLSRTTILALVLRDQSYSRTGLIALGILYDDHFGHLRSMELPALLADNHPQVAYYCAYREAYPASHSSDITTDPGVFVFAGLRYVGIERSWDKYANRGPSALLDGLEWIESEVPQHFPDS